MSPFPDPWPSNWWPPEPTWIAHNDAPPDRRDPVMYELMLATCKEDWEKRHDPQTFAVAVRWVGEHRQFLPSWLHSNASVELLWLRSKKHINQQETHDLHAMRWLWVKRIQNSGEVIWDEAYELAALQLSKTIARGSAEAIRKSYMKFQNRLKTSPARKALIEHGLASGLRGATPASRPLIEGLRTELSRRARR
jgi:hypothetical protein